MTSLPAVGFANVSKRFVLTRERPQSILETMIAAVSRRRRDRHDELWAVRDVSFDVLPGESLGLVGRNGSGKSTVLKLAARILRPTSGEVTIRGRVSALLELGTGFHPDLTGRENIFLNGSVLGLSQQAIRRRFDAIVAFSELEAFIDAPVKHYSSGMYMRLGFSVAVEVDPDILMVDEILAVGDQPFQAKCLERIYEMQRRGVTIFMVSHNLEMVAQVCQALVWLDHGQMRAVGPTHEVAALYREDAFRKQMADLTTAAGDRATVGDEGTAVAITAVRFLDGGGRPCEAFQTGDTVTIEVEYAAQRPLAQPEVVLRLYRQDGVFVAMLAAQPEGWLEAGGRGVLCGTIEALPLLPAMYYFTAGVNAAGQTTPGGALPPNERKYVFRVLPGRSESGRGLVELPVAWEWRDRVTG